MTNSETREWDRVVDKHTLTETGTVTKRWTHTVCVQWDRGGRGIYAADTVVTIYREGDE